MCNCSTASARAYRVPQSPVVTVSAAFGGGCCVRKNALAAEQQLGAECQPGGGEETGRDRTLGVAARIQQKVTTIIAREGRMIAEVRSPDLRARFIRSELSLFRNRFETDDVQERATFLRSLAFDWDVVDASEKAKYAEELRACMPWGTKDDAFRAESWFKVSRPLLDPHELQLRSRSRGIPFLIWLAVAGSSYARVWPTYRRARKSVWSCRHSRADLRRHSR